MSNVYTTNRYSFREQARRIGAAQFSYPLEGHTGPEGEDLSCDVAVVDNPHAKYVVAITSGIHGVELPFGSELQVQWLAYAQEICADNPGISFVFVHALNPYGAAYGLRTDHQNIDPNRNFVDFTQAQSPSLSYRELAPAFAPKKLSRSALACSWVKMLHFAGKNGMAKFLQALAGGQYEFPEGLYYGGKAPSWTRETWQKIVKTHVVHAELQNLWHVDIHTGYGPFGKLQLMVNTEEGSELHQRVQRLGPPDSIEVTDAFLADLSGDIVDSLGRLVDLPSQTVVTPFAIEVGTTKFKLPGLDVLNAMILRNTLAQRHQDQHPWAQAIIGGMRNMFYPPDDVWRNVAMAQSNDIWNKLLTVVQAQAQL